jgi:hypothetical protein
LTKPERPKFSYLSNYQWLRRCYKIVGTPPRLASWMLHKELVPD